VPEKPDSARTRVSRFINIFSCGERSTGGDHRCMRVLRAAPDHAALGLVAEFRSAERGLESFVTIPNSSYSISSTTAPLDVFTMPRRLPRWSLNIRKIPADVVKPMS
jgi:hypothetical protein